MVDSKEEDNEDSFYDKFKRFKINNTAEKKSPETIDQSLISQIAYNEKIRIAITSIIASASLTISKFIIAIYTNSLGLLSEGMHSGLDVLAALMTLYAIRMSRKPPDPKHNYGYAKFESLTSLGAVLLLFIVAGWIFYEGLERILFKQVIPEITVFSFGILIEKLSFPSGSSF